MPEPYDFDVDGLLAQVQAQQEEVQRIQRSVEQMEVKGGSRHNEVTVWVRGTGEFSEISIDPDLLRRHGPHEIGDIVVEAVNDGVRKLREASAAKFKPIIDAAGTEIGQGGTPTR